MPLTQQRDVFDLPEDIVYLNCAAQSPSIKASYEAGQKGLLRKHHPWSEERSNHGPEIEKCRELFGKLINTPGASGENVALVGSTSYGAAVAANGIDLKRGQTIVLIEGQFPSNYYIWTELAQRDGAEIKTVNRPANFNWTRDILAAIDENCGLVTLPNCHWADGSFIDLEAISEKVHQVGAAFFIDATQSIGVYALDVQKLNPDYVMCSGYKWLLSPDAAGYLYVADRRLDKAPIEHNHAGRTGGPPMELSTDYAPDFKAGARRFDYGAADSMVHQPMMVTALEQIIAWGQDNISAYITDLIDHTAELAEARGMTAPPKNCRIGHFVGLMPSGEIDPQMAVKLAAQKVYVSLRGSRLRVSPYLFNNKADIDALFEAIDRI